MSVVDTAVLSPLEQVAKRRHAEAATVCAAPHSVRLEYATRPSSMILLTRLAGDPDVRVRQQVAYEIEMTSPYRRCGSLRSALAVLARDADPTVREVAVRAGGTNSPTESIDPPVTTQASVALLRGTWLLRLWQRIRRRWSTAPRLEQSPAGESPQLEESEADPIGKCA